MCRPLGDFDMATTSVNPNTLVTKKTYYCTYYKCGLIVRTTYYLNLSYNHYDDAD